MKALHVPQGEVHLIGQLGIQAAAPQKIAQRSVRFELRIQPLQDAAHILEKRVLPPQLPVLRLPLIARQLHERQRRGLRDVERLPGIPCPVSSTSTMTWPWSIEIPIDGEKDRSISPLGPFTVMLFSTSFTSTPDGISTGFLPILDMIKYSLK